MSTNKTKLGAQLGRRDFIRQSAQGAAALSVPLAITACTGSGDALEPPVSDKAYPPSGMHVSFLDDARTTRGLCWFTDGTENPGSFVQWAPVEGDLSDAEVQDLDAHPLLFQTEGAAEKTIGVDRTTHQVTVTDIPADKPFRYRVGSEAGGWSAVSVVKPTPPEGEVWKFIHYGDMGYGHRAQRLVAETQKPRHAHSLCLIAGDISYADGNHERWDQWFDTFEPYLKENVVMTVPGNHENKDQENPDDNYLTFPNYAYNNRFHQPGEISFYGMDYNRIFIYAFTAGAFLEDGKLLQELLDLEIALAQAAIRRAAGEIDFIAVVQHYTIWTDQEGRAPGNASLILLQEQILARYGVDFVMCGHDHVYQRSERMLLGQPDPTGLGYIQILTGTGGISIRLFEPNIQRWSAKEFVGIGFTEYTVDGGTITARFYGSAPVDMETRDQIEQADVAQDFPLVDEFTIEKRGLPLAQQFARSPRNAEQLLAAFDWNAMQANIRERNNNPHSHA